MPYEFDVALSFAGSERDYARTIAAIAKANGLTVFLDELFEADLWGKNLVESLSDIYETKARYCLIIVSEEYRKRVFTNVERRAALDRAIRDRAEYILPVVVDNSWIDGLPKATAYLDLRKRSVIAICEILVEKVKGVRPSALTIPKDINVARLSISTLSTDDLRRYLIDLCAQSKQAGVVAFGCLIYDESTVELRKLLKDEDYWDALDKASGPSFEIFALRDEVKYGQESSGTIEMLTATSHLRSRSQGYHFSALLNDYFGEKKTTLVYPSFMLFLVEGNRVTHCRLIPLSRGGIHEAFLELQSLFQCIAAVLASWRQTGPNTSAALWEMLKKDLLAADHTLYIQKPPSDAGQAIQSLARFFG